MEPNVAPKRRGRPPVKIKFAPKPEAKSIPLMEGEIRMVEGLMKMLGDLPPESLARPAMRNAMRPDMRKEDSRAAAARRTAEILGNLGDDVIGESVDKFSAPPAPDGWTYEWKTKTVLNQEQFSYQSGLKRTGWQEVPTSRHPEEMPSTGSWPCIERDGMVLMERPKAVTNKVREAEARKAKAQVQTKKEQLGERKPGQFGPDDPRVQPKVKNSYAPMPVPDDA